MRIIGVDLHTRQQSVAMVNVETGEIVEKTLRQTCSRHPFGNASVFSQKPD